MKQQFYTCKHCGNIIAFVRQSSTSVVCCGEKMTELVPGPAGVSHEKHTPVYTVNDNTVHVQVGSIEHPMFQAHRIEWISIQTRHGNQRKELYLAGKPEAYFSLCKGDVVEAVYAYCNLHGLWKAQPGLAQKANTETYSN